MSSFDEFTRQLVVLPYDYSAPPRRGTATSSITTAWRIGAYKAGPCIYCSPGETSDIAARFSIGAGAFQIAYIEANGSPSDLAFSVAVPEASTWAMMMLGLCWCWLPGLSSSEPRLSLPDCVSGRTSAYKQRGRPWAAFLFKVQLNRSCEASDETVQFPNDVGR